MRHFCESSCIVCASDQCPETENSVVSINCNMTCRPKECYDRHQQSKGTKDKPLPSECEKWWKCTTCKKVPDLTKRDMKDQYREWVCQCCQKHVLGEHECVLCVQEPLPIQTKFIIFDFETRQDDINQCSHGYEPASIISCERSLKEELCCTKCEFHFAQEISYNQKQ